MAATRNTTTPEPSKDEPGHADDAPDSLKPWVAITLAAIALLGAGLAEARPSRPASFRFGRRLLLAARDLGHQVVDHVEDLAHRAHVVDHVGLDLAVFVLG